VIRGGYRPPAVSVDLRRWSARVMPGECHHELIRSDQLEVSRTQVTVVSIACPLGRQRHMQRIRNRGQGAAHSPEPGVTFPDVVEKRGLRCDTVTGPSLQGGAHDVDGVPLILRPLRPEEVGGGITQQRVNLGLFPGCWRPCQQEAEESTDEVCRLRHSAVEGGD
jgi:hypothetical protein